MHISAPLSNVNSSALRHAFRAALCNEHMRTIEEVRRLRLALLVKEFGSFAELNEKTGRLRHDSTLSQYANSSKNSKGGAAKAMGSPVARALEVACNKPVGWMDTDPDLWPFEKVDLDRILAAGERAIDRLEGALLLTAAQLGLDIDKRNAA